MYVFKLKTRLDKKQYGRVQFTGFLELISFSLIVDGNVL